MATDITSENYDQHATEGVVLLDFWAPWCGPCRGLTPVIEQLSKEYAGKALIGKVNCDEEQALAAKFEIRAMPTIIIMKDGEIVANILGARAKPDYVAALNKALGVGAA
jgi:thioredoxin 1